MAACLLSEGRRDTPPSMTWRRIAPWVILAITLVALYIDIPRTTIGVTFLPLPDSIRTVLGLDLQGGISVTLEVQAVSGEEPDPERVELAPGHHRAARRGHRRHRAARFGPRSAPTARRGSWSRSRASATETRSSSSSGRPVSSCSSTLPGHPVRGPEHHRPDRRRHGQRPVRRGRDPAGQRRPGHEPERAARRELHPLARGGGHLVRLRPPTSTSLARSPSMARSSPPRPFSSRSAAVGRSSPLAPGLRRRSRRRRSTTSSGSAPCPSRSRCRGSIASSRPWARNFLNQALVAGGIGLLLVLFFMIANYRLPGVLAAVALLFYTLVCTPSSGSSPVTLTLAGVAAFILWIGMAVDANILIFERMKEEIRAGKTLGAGHRGRLQSGLVEHPRLERRARCWSPAGCSGRAPAWSGASPWC